MMDLSQFTNKPRILIEAQLKPIQGDRFQPTGFPDLGAATYRCPNEGVDMLLVESAQSMANRLEAVCWDDVRGDVVPELEGMPYVKVMLLGASGKPYTCSILEFHRLSSPYIRDSAEGFNDTLSAAAGIVKRKSKSARGDSSGTLGMLDITALARACFRYDPGSVLHGVFLEKIDGRARLPRLLSAFIEASNVRPVESGGVKFDKVDPTGNASDGYGHVPFHRTEYVAGDMRAYFSLDVAALRGYGLGDQGERFLFLLALWKIRALLEGDLRLRTACDLGVIGIYVTMPKGLVLPEAAVLADELRDAIHRCSSDGLFAAPPTTVLNWNGPKPPAKAGRKAGEVKADEEDAPDVE